MCARAGQNPFIALANLPAPSRDCCAESEAHCICKRCCHDTLVTRVTKIVGVIFSVISHTSEKRECGAHNIVPLVHVDEGSSYTHTHGKRRWKLGCHPRITQQANLWCVHKESASLSQLTRCLPRSPPGRNCSSCDPEAAADGCRLLQRALCICGGLVWMLAAEAAVGRISGGGC